MGNTTINIKGRLSAAHIKMYVKMLNDEFDTVNRKDVNERNEFIDLKIKDSQKKFGVDKLISKFNKLEVKQHCLENEINEYCHCYNQTYINYNTPQKKIEIDVAPKVIIYDNLRKSKQEKREKLRGDLLKQIMLCSSPDEIKDIFKSLPVLLK